MHAVDDVGFGDACGPDIELETAQQSRGRRSMNRRRRGGRDEKRGCIL